MNCWLTNVVVISKCNYKDLPLKFSHQELYPCHGNTTIELQACLGTQSWLSLHNIEQNFIGQT